VALSATSVRKVKPRARPFRLADEKGLYLETRPNGSKYWRMKFRFAGREKLLALGVWPEVTLKQARDRRDQARRLVADGIDPSAERHAEKVARALRAGNSFEAIAREWFEKQTPLRAAGHRRTVLRRLELDAFPWLGARPIAEISAPELLSVLRRVEARGTVYSAHRLRGVCGRVFRYAIATGRAERDPASDLRGALSPAKEQHYAAITDPKTLGDLLRAIEGYQGSLVARCALQLAPLVFVRPGELRRAEWSEIDLEGATWLIPAERMKMREAHIVPLASQAVAILREILPLTGRWHYVFPSSRTARRPMSENTVNAALRRLGYAKGEVTGHGFRATASTLLHEQGWAPDVIERQLAHAERSKVRAAYNRAEHLPERRRMMQAWADYLYALRDGAQVIPFRRTTA
jgi:integrase